MVSIKALGCPSWAKPRRCGVLAAAIEDAPGGNAPYPLLVDGYSEEQIGYHSFLIVDAGLAAGPSTTALGGSSPSTMILHLTAAGHDFADAARNDTIWKKAIATVKDKGGSASIGVLFALL